MTVPVEAVDDLHDMNQNNKVSKTCSTACVSPSHTPPGTPPQPPESTTSNLRQDISKGSTASRDADQAIQLLASPAQDSTTLPLPPSQSTSSSPRRTATGQPANTSHLPISADYIMGINQIDLGPRVNDLSKM